MQPDLPAHVDRVALVSLIAGVAVIGANSLALGPIAPGIASDLGETVVQVLYGSVAFGVGTAFSAFMLAPQIDRLGAGRGMVLALGILAMALAATGLAPSVGWLITAQAAAGLAAGLGLPAIYALAALIAPPGKTNTVLGYVLIGWTLSLIGGVAISALVADLLHWRAVYGGLGLLGAVVTLLGFKLALNDRPAAAGAPSALRALQIPGVLPLLLICFAFMAAFYGVYGFIGDHLVTGLGRPVRSMAAIVVSYGVGFGAAAAVDRFIDRYGAHRLMLPCFVLIGVIYAMIAAFANSYIALVALAFAWGVANHFGLNLIVASLSAIDVSRRGAILGLNSGITYVAMSAGTYCYGLLYERLGFVALALSSCGLCVATAPYAWYLYRTGRQQVCPGRVSAGD